MFLEKTTNHMREITQFKRDKSYNLLKNKVK
jgi:hypothetical protein